MSEEKVIFKKVVEYDKDAFIDSILGKYANSYSEAFFKPFYWFFKGLFIMLFGLGLIGIFPIWLFSVLIDNIGKRRVYWIKCQKKNK